LFYLKLEGIIAYTLLMAMQWQGLFGKKSLCKLDFCENCVLGKSHRVSFDVGRHTTQGVIDYVHSDLWGLSQVESLGGKRYFLSIVDDYSRRVWVYLLRFKHEAFEKFKEWKQLIENQTGRTVKKLRTDNGLEFCELNASVEEKENLAQGAIHLSRNHVFHERTKHINVRYHFIREVLKAKTVEVLKVGTEHNVANALPNVVPRHKLQHCLELLSVGIC
nr:retrovirus-related Pol polyprotein from transposon TNT 1-94 [Tanacetum cinerariifolium]